MFDWVTLWVTLHVLDEERFQCGPCQSKDSGREDSEAMRQKRRTVMGCWGGEQFVHQLSDDHGRTLRAKTCLGNLYRNEWVTLLPLYSQWKLGTMPYPGSPVDQPNKVIEAFHFIDGYMAVVMKRKAQEEQVKLSKRRGQRRGR